MFPFLKVILSMFFLLFDDINNFIGYGNRMSVFTEAQYRSPYPECENGMCGETVEKLVMHGDEVDNLHKYPFIITFVLTGNYSNYICGGFLISPDFVLTAGHCVQRKNSIHLEKCQQNRMPPECFYDAHELQVGIVGALNEAELLTYVDVLTVIPHPNFQMTEAIHDIALVQLKFPIHCKLQATPICLPYTVLSKPGDILRIAGRGLDLTVQGENKDEKLLEGRVHQIELDHCRDPMSKERQIICVSGILTNQASCKGDSGTPLFQMYGGQFFALGITSTGPPECEIEEPHFYTDIFPYMGWIRNHVDNLPEVFEEEKLVGLSNKEEGEKEGKDATDRHPLYPMIQPLCACI